MVGIIAFHAIELPNRIKNSQDMSQKLFLNSSKVTAVHPIAGTDNNFFLSPEDLSNEKVWSAVANIDIPVLRFPGGEGNWYDWKTGAIVTEGRATFEFMEKSKPKTVSMDAFMSHARMVGASVSYVLNIMDSPESIRELAFHWQQTNAPVQWVEMGNEYYHQNFSQEIGGSAGYMQRARQAQKDSSYMAEQHQLKKIEFMAFIHDDEVRILAWNREPISTRINIELPNFTTQFLCGEVLHGNLLDKNGSLISKSADSPPWVEKIVPNEIYTPLLKGPGIVMLRFSAALNM